MSHFFRSLGLFLFFVVVFLTGIFFFFVLIPQAWVVPSYGGEPPAFRPGLLSHNSAGM